jgi:quercetin dioxygenase-like cupin family protein
MFQERHTTASSAREFNAGIHYHRIRLKSTVRSPNHQIKTQSVKEVKMDIKRAGSKPSGKGPADWFTGTVRVDPLFNAPAPARVVGASVTFEPGARTAWHTHPLGQTLIVTAGCGRARRWGGPIEEIRPGDVVWIPPGEKHWHGAAPTTAMTHFAVQEQLDGKAVDWMEKVSDEQYQG